MKCCNWLLFLILALVIGKNASAQNDTCHLKISLLTCSPGEDLYSIFGHSALRVQDALAHTDVIFNYGTFDFDDPDFYVNFVKGKLLYYVSVERFDIFLYQYHLENRSIIEQELSLNCQEKEQLYNALRINAREENKYYRYEFLFDNCSTRLRDMVAKNNGDTVSFKNILTPETPTFRDLIHQYLNAGKKYWSKFGIDLVLASRIDRKVKNEEAMFLPDYLMKGFDSCVTNHAPLVMKKKTILGSTPMSEDDSTIFTPLVVTMLLLAFGIVITFINKPWAKRAGNVFDISLFLILGIVGCFMLFMWFGTEHELCRDNYNVIWALPTHLVMAFLVQKRSLIIKRYFTATAAICAIFLIAIPFIPQSLNVAFLPLILISGLRAANRAIK